MVVGMRGLALGVSVVALSLSAGCAEPPPEAEARLAALEAEGQQMDAALDTVEDRLLGNQARVHLWQELGERHQQVSAIHCKHAHGNVEAIIEHEEKQEEKARKLKRSHSVASVDSTVLTSGKEPPSSHD